MTLLEQIESRLAVCAKATPGTKPKFMELKRFLDSSRNQREGELAALKVAVKALFKLSCQPVGDGSPVRNVGKKYDELCDYLQERVKLSSEALTQITKLMGEGV